MCQGMPWNAAFAVPGHVERVTQEHAERLSGHTLVEAESLREIRLFSEVAEEYTALTPKDCAGTIHDQYYGIDRRRGGGGQ